MTDSPDLSLLRVVFAFSVVLALMAGLGVVLKYIGARGFCLSPKGRKPKRLQIIESLPLDARRRCVIVRCDEHEHLLLLGGQDDIVVEANLPSVKDQSVP